MTVEVAAGVGVLVAAGLLVWHVVGQDVRLCRQVLVGLVRGEQSVRDKIDWDHLTALDVAVGATYAQFNDAKEQAAYQRVFVQKFAEGFAQAKADASMFTGWRAERDGTVSVEYPAKSKTLVFRLSGSGKQVAGLAWR